GGLPDRENAGPRPALRLVGPSSPDPAFARLRSRRGAVERPRLDPVGPADLLRLLPLAVAGHAAVAERPGGAGPGLGRSGGGPGPQPRPAPSFPVRPALPVGHGSRRAALSGRPDPGPRGREHRLVAARRASDQPW